jgi:charged multivesicular body protein 7
MSNPTAEASTTISSYLSTLPEFASTPRIQSLYSDLGRQKLSNPTGYAANLTWWRSTLQELVSKRLQPTSDDALVLHVDQNLSDALRWEKVGRPAGLAVVIVSPIND